MLRRVGLILSVVYAYNGGIKERKTKMTNWNEIMEASRQEEMALIEAWEEKWKDFHDFDNFLDDEVVRCNKCGMNVLGKFATCEEYTADNIEKNRRLRELAGL
jgi:hypothetical protein